MRSDYPNSNEPSEDPDDAVARWEAYRALVRRKGDIQMMSWLEEDDAKEVEPASRWFGGHAEHPSFAPADPAISADTTAEPEAPVDLVPDIAPPPAEPRHEPRKGVQGAWPLSARLFGAMAVLVAGLALAAALMPRHPDSPDLASRTAPPALQSGLGGLAKLAANEAPGAAQASPGLPLASPLADANAAPMVLARPVSLQQSSTARHTRSHHDPAGIAATPRGLITGRSGVRSAGPDTGDATPWRRRGI